MNIFKRSRKIKEQSHPFKFIVRLFSFLRIRISHTLMIRLDVKIISAVPIAPPVPGNAEKQSVFFSADRNRPRRFRSPALQESKSVDWHRSCTFSNCMAYGYENNYPSEATVGDQWLRGPTSGPREAWLYDRAAGEAVICNLCAHRCFIPAGRSGVCKVRENRAGLCTRSFTTA